MAGNYNMGSSTNPRTFTRESLNTAIASGGQRSSGADGLLRTQQRVRIAARTQPGSLGAATAGFEKQLSGAAQGYANIAGRDLRRGLGIMLGDLNSIGALRSGAVQAGVDQASREYGKTIGDYSSMLALEGARMGQEEFDRETERRFRERQYRDARRASKRRGLGRALGALGGGIVGAMTGGPVGAVAGASVGQRVFG